MCNNCKKDDCPDSCGLMHCKCHKDSEKSRGTVKVKYSIDTIRKLQEIAIEKNIPIITAKQRPKRKEQKGKYWIRFIHQECPVCGYEKTYQERIFDKQKPIDPLERHIYEIYYDYCIEMDSLRS